MFRGLQEHIKDEGQYILKHDPSSGAFVKVMKAGDKGQKPFDLHAFFKKIDPAIDDPCINNFKQLDMETVTPWHWNKGQVPGLFKPCTIQKTDPKRRRGRGRGRGRGRKKI